MNLLVFNLKTDVDDDVLGFTTDWINALAGEFNRVYVITMQAGKIQVAPNVTVFSAGKEKGYSRPRRLLEFYRHLWQVLQTGRIDACFAHMMPLFTVMGWPLLSLRRIPIVLWFAHKASPPMLRVAHRLADKIVTSVPGGFSLKSRKMVVIGQGISEDKFGGKPIRTDEGRENIISVGRISPVKNLLALVEAFVYHAKVLGRTRGRLVLLGSASTETDRKYRTVLEEMIKRNGIGDRVLFAGAVPHREVASWLEQSCLSVNLCPTGAIDKAGLESLAAGVPILVRNQSFTEVFNVAGIDPAVFMVDSLEREKLGIQLSRFLDCDSIPVETRKKLAQSVLEQHGLRQLSRRLSREIQSLVRPDRAA